jgi:hypothetical protein
MPEAKKQSLAEFAGDQKRDAEWLSRQPVCAEVVQGYHDGIAVPVIRMWLVRERGFNDKQLPSEEAIRRYLRTNHARP